MDVKAAIEAGDDVALRRLLGEDPRRADALVAWGRHGEILTHPLHYVSDALFSGTLAPERALPIVDALLEAGADLDFTEPANRRETPLIGAASLGAEDVGLRLLDAGARADITGLFGETALHWAALLGAARLAGRLIDAGAPLDLEDRQYRSTPLGWALHGRSEPPPGSRGEHLAVIARLVAAGARVEPRTLASEKVRNDPAVMSLLAGRQA